MGETKIDGEKIKSMNQQPVRVRITKCHNENFWYNDSIGEEFEVVEDDFSNSLWIIISGDAKESVLHKSDCEVILQPEPEKYSDAEWVRG